MKLRVLCLHSFRLSGENMRLQMSAFSNFASTIEDLVDLDFCDGGHQLPDEANADVPEKLRQICLRRKVMDPPGNYQGAPAKEKFAALRKCSCAITKDDSAHVSCVQP